MMRCKALNYNNQPENKGLSKGSEIWRCEGILLLIAPWDKPVKLSNACIREYGLPDTIVVELAREVGKKFSW